MIQFGPDGYLYIAMGDGDFGDSDRNGALTETLLGSILRIDVDAADPYAVPTDNPYVGSSTAAPEIWMSGMRNPWRFFIDAPTRSIVVGDVGQFEWEEIQLLSLDESGLDLGWPTMEGKRCYQASACDETGFVIPDVVFSHGNGCAMVAGPVYRGSLLPELSGMVVYADYCTGRMGAYSLVAGKVSQHRLILDPGPQGPVLSLAVDDDGEILLLTELGEIRRLQRAA
jgi:glucose/arabinose dehydrogenase